MEDQKTPHGFTLIEMMIVVAIIGILASVSMPWYQRFQMRSKVAEGKLNLAAMRAAEGGYFGEYGRYVAMAQAPGPVLTAPGVGNVKRPWTTAASICPAVITAGSPGHCVMGFFPEGPTYYNYGVTVSPALSSYFADAVSDVDDDDRPNTWGVEVPIENSVAASGLVGVNGCTTVYDPFNNPVLLRQIGPCGIGHGLSVF